MSNPLLVALAAATLLAPATAAAYIGPGAGLGAIGSLVAVLGALVLAIVGLIVLPVRMLMRSRKARASDARHPSAATPPER